jgi:hypothetical protein
VGENELGDLVREAARQFSAPDGIAHTHLMPQ